MMHRPLEPSIGGGTFATNMAVELFMLLIRRNLLSHAYNCQALVPNPKPIHPTHRFLGMNLLYIFEGPLLFRSFQDNFF